MSSNENNNKSIYLKSTRQWVPVSDELYDEYRREIDAYIHKMRSHKCCRCPKSKWWLCDKDCWTCAFHCSDEFTSLDAPINDNIDSDDITLCDTIADDSPSIESIIYDQELLNRLFEALNSIDPDRGRICKLWANGMSERDIADRLGKPQTTINYQKKKAFEELREILKNFI